MSKNVMPHTVPLTTSDLSAMTALGWVAQNPPLAVREGTLLVLTMQWTTTNADGSTVEHDRTLIGFLDEERRPSFDDSRLSFHAGIAVRLGLTMVQAYSRWQAWATSANMLLRDRRDLEASGFLAGFEIGDKIGAYRG